MIADSPVEMISPSLLDVSSLALPEVVRKRDGRVVAFQSDRISRAIERCFRGISADPHTSVDDLTLRALNAITARGARDVEAIQDLVEMTLAGAGEFAAAKAYILYRAEHARLRAERPVPLDVREAFRTSKRYFPTQLQEFQFYDKYSRFDETKGRRETWPETVDRSVDFLKELVRTNVGQMEAGLMEQDGSWLRLREGILEMRAMPSMRLLAMAGPAARRQNAALYNCSFVNLDCMEAFGEIMALSMAGCGVGFSVERRHVAKLPVVQSGKQSHVTPIFVVEDSTEGWCAALTRGLEAWFDGRDVKFDFGEIRPAGAPLKTKGGRASGPAPLQNLLEFARTRIRARAGGHLRPLDAHDLACMVGNAAVSGGVRRTALISLFDLDDEEMARCKVGDFETRNSQRWNANNSAVIPEEGITQAQFLKLWTAMVESERGEPGLISRQAMRKTLPERRQWCSDFGMNPCAEVVLRPMGLCNLSIAVARADDTPETLAEKVELATILGTIQSLATHFPGLRPEWQRNAEEERLLGVDITGQRDCPILNADLFERLRDLAVSTNVKWSRRLGINQSAAVTVVKPSGNSSVLLDCSSGIHPRWAPFYERNVRVAATSPITAVLKDAGVSLSPENGQEGLESPNTYVVTFPVKSPDSAVFRADLSAVEQAEWWLTNKLHWTEHNPSVTIQYRPDEVIPLMTWVWQHMEVLGGMSFLPYSDVKLAQLPYAEVSAERYAELVEAMPEIDFSRLVRHERVDETTASSEVACVAGACEV